MKLKKIIINIIVPLFSVFISVGVSYMITQISINNQNEILKQEYKRKLLEKRMSIIDEISKLIGASPGMDDMFNIYIENHVRNESLNLELIQKITDYNANWQSNIMLSVLYFGESTSIAIKKMSEESAPWWRKNKNLQDEYLNSMMKELYLGFEND